MLKWLAIVAASVVAIGAAYAWMSASNASVVEELRAKPDGERARKVMLLTLPSGKTLPVNYLRDGNVVYAAADFPWWRELRERGGRGSVLIRGETLFGRVRVVRDDAALRDSVFSRLRPTAPRFLGTLVVVELEGGHAVLLAWPHRSDQI